MEEILFCLIVEFLFIAIPLQIMGLLGMMRLFSFASKSDCIISFLCLFFILTCVWLVTRETYHVFVVKDGKGIL